MRRTQRSVAERTVGYFIHLPFTLMDALKERAIEEGDKLGHPVHVSTLVRKYVSQGLGRNRNHSTNKGDVS